MIGPGDLHRLRQLALAILAGSARDRDARALAALVLAVTDCSIRRSNAVHIDIHGENDPQELARRLAPHLNGAIGDGEE